MFIQFEKDSKTPLTTQIADGLRQAILNGTLKPGQKMPSTRELATSLDLARNTIANAYDQLLSEGLVECLPGSGTYVTDVAARKDAALPSEQGAPNYKLSKYADNLTGQVAASSALISYRLPRRQDLPMDKWHKLTLQYSKTEKKEGPAWCADPLGYLPLRTALSDYLQMSRALTCDAERIVLFPSRREALDFFCKVLSESGDIAAIERPSHPMLTLLLKGNGMKIEQIRTDGDGMCVDDLAGRGEIRMVFVAPSNQVLTGAIMSLDRRTSLIEWAEANHAMIIEDDFDCEFALETKHLQQAIQGMDTKHNVIYIGSFAHALAPLTEQAYAVIPQALVEITRKAREVFAGCVARLEEKVLADFITKGDFNRHLRELRTKYLRRREVLLKELESIKEILDVLPDTSGTSLLVQLKTTATAEKVEVCGSKAGIPMVSTTAFGDTAAAAAGRFLLSYCRVPESDVRQSVKLFAAYLKEAEVCDAKELMLKHGRLSLG